jgi:hypothetical protein
MAQFNLKEFVYHHRNGKPVYYSYDEELYCGTFPTMWAETHAEGTGPKECGNCAYYGSWNGVFLGYCANCAYVYNGERCRGLIEVGIENDDNEVLDFPSIFDTYLEGVSLDDVGDTDFMDSFAVVKFEDFQTPSDESEEEIHNMTFEERYPDIDLDEVNAHYDEMCRIENEREEEVGFVIDREGYGSSYDGGYDSY